MDRMNQYKKKETETNFKENDKYFLTQILV